MDLHGYMRALRKSWWLVVVCLLAGLGVAAAYVAATPKHYSAEVRLFVSAPTDSSSDITSALSGSSFTQARVKSYADIVDTPEVTEAVIDQLHLTLTPGQLAGELAASAPVNEVVLNITATDASPARAQAITNAVGTRLTEVVNQLEAPEGGGPSPVKLSIVQAAALPTVSASPKKKADLAVGLLIGIALGVAGAVLRTALDRSVRTPEEISALVGLTTLGAIAFDPEAANKPLVVNVSPHSQRAEAFRQLRTNLQFVDVDNPPRSLVITSAVPREGKSTTTTNLAITFAQTGLHVLLVEGDLRRPRVTRYAGLPDNLPGLTDVLIGKAGLESVIIPFPGTTGLDVLPAGANPPNPSELLASKNMVSVLTDSEAKYDIVVIDAPPLLPVTDGAILGSIADATIVVVRAGKTTREQLSRAVASLTAIDVKAVGAVLNLVPTRGPDSGHYGYGSGYGYSAKGYGTYGDKPKPGDGGRTQLAEDAVPTLEPAQRGNGPLSKQTIR